MLKTRVIPTLLWKKFGLVKGVGFDSWRRVGPVLPAIKVYNQREVDELVLFDIEANVMKREPDYESIKEFSCECFVPFAVGGGISKIEQVQKLLENGADKICVNSTIYFNPYFVTEIANKYGSQCVVACLDVRKVHESWQCFSLNGQYPTGRDVLEMAREVAGRGAGELILTSIERDGTMNGYDLDLIRLVSESVDIPVIASGGAGNYQHMIEAGET